jgi:threonine dehydrogenase-like Zn-dependent dehydrogenase
VGEVESCGPGVGDWRPGDRAVPIGEHLGMAAAESQGGYCEAVVVRASSCVRVPESLPSLRAVIAEPLANGLHFVRRGRFQRGQRVAILGAGQIGLSILYWVRRWGAGRVAVSEPVERRAQLAAELGADAVLDPRACGDVGAAITEALGGSPEVVFEAVGRADVMEAAIQMAAPGGVVVLAGITLEEVPIRPLALCLKENDLVFPIGTNRDEVAEVIQVLDRGEFPVERFVSHRIELAQVPAVLKELGKPSDQIKVVIDYARPAQGAVHG